ncbi:MAG TPA: glutamate-1-semialdehyde 2,1-aminomutase [Egibacteraceae bacterium]|nr:glutamate-1-semialdehyde 2,1-aminomutase [Egibacteraceae bacterium]
MTTSTPSTALSEVLYARAQAVIPGGVNSPVRAFRGVGGTPRFMASGAGAVIRDVDGNAYRDYVMSWGPLIAGHAHPGVLAAARDALERGSSFGAPTAAEVELAEEIRERYPAAERVRLVSSGTEAGMSAVRVARGATGRDRIVKFAGHYHGHADALLAAAGSGVATFGLPDSPGVTKAAVADTIVVAWNDRSAVEAAFAEHGAEVAALVCEPVAANMGVVPPEPGFLAFLHDVTTRHGALLCFDEVMTGFRLARGGAAELYGVSPDLVTFGKVVGGGFPLAAFGGSAEVMDHLAPVGPVYQAGTLSGNPVAVAAGQAQLGLLDGDAYALIDGLADRLVTGLAAAFAAAGVAAVVQRAGNLFGLFFTPPGGDGGPVRDYAGARAADHARYAAFFTGMLARGHYLPPSGYEALFVSLAHTPEDIDATVAAAAEVLEAAGWDRDPPDP